MFPDYFCGIQKNKYILSSLVSRDLIARYRKSKLGVLWSVLTPLGLSLIVGMVYSILFGVSPKDFIPSLFAGLNPWTFLSGVAEAGTGAFLMAEGYIKQTTVDAQIYPLRVTLGAFVNLLYSVLAFFCIYLFMQPDAFGPRMLMCIPGLMIMFFFALGVANIVSIVNLDIRDYQPFQSILLQGLFYATPVIYPKERLAEAGFAIIYEINPLYYMLEVVRAPMLGKELPSLRTYLIAIVCAAISFGVGVCVVMKNKKYIALKL